MSVTPLDRGSSKMPPSLGPGAAKALKAPVPGQWSLNDGSTPTQARTLNALFQSYAPLGYYLPWETLDYIELLATYNPDYSQAVDNIRTLANSGHELFVDARSNRTSERIKGRLEEKARTIQVQHGGIDGLLDKLLDQAATYGAMCFSSETEIITSEGVRPIGELVGQTVQVMSRGGRWIKAPISSFGVQPLQKITLRRGRGEKVVYATPEHRWLVQSAAGVPGARQQRIKGQSRTTAPWERDCSTSALCSGDVLVDVSGDQSQGILHDLLALSPWGVAAGIVYGDGCAPNTHRGNKMSAYVDLYNENIDDLLKWFPLSSTEVTKPNWAGRGLRVRGLPRSWKALPSVSEDSSYLFGWLAGYFAADGCVSTTGTAVISSMSESSMRMYRDLLVRFGVRCTLSSIEARGGGTVEERDYGKKWKVSFHSSEMPERFYIRPHHALRYSQRVRPPLPWTVVSVESTDRSEEVFCATVPSTSCFALEGNILTGNCGEWILNDELTDVVDFADINPKSIRFKWDESKQTWMPYQKVTPQQAQSIRGSQRRLTVGAQNYVELNPETFRYFAFDAAPGSPYGTPPFLAALGNIAIQSDMVHNMSQIVKKVGLLGIIDIVVKQLPMQAGETDEEYMTRAGNYLDQYVEVVQDMVRDGGLVHYDDIESKVVNITGNAAGATNIFKQNEELIFSGLKSMPSVQGRSYSTTETYAGVAYDIIIRNTRKYQRAAKRMIEDGYWLMCTMWGEQPRAIRLTFNENKTLHRVQDAQAEQMEIKNGLMLWETGVIDQLGFAQRLGFSTPKREMEEPPKSPLISNADSGAISDEGGDPNEDRSDSEDTRSDE